MDITELLAGLGQTPPATDPAPIVTDTAPATDPITEPVVTEPNSVTGGATPPATTEPEPIVDPVSAEPNSASSSASQKQSKAFAEMRVQNQQYNKTLKALGDLLGAQNVNDPNAILNLVQEKIVQAQAKAQGVPADILTKLNMLEAEQQKSQAQAVQQQALLGFQNVKNKFGLDDKGLEDFSNQLVSLGLNPFETQVDLVRVYRDVNFETLQAKAIEKAIADERARALKASQGSTTPSNTNGGAGDPNQVQIKDVKGLESWFEKQSK